MFGEVINGMDLLQSVNRRGLFDDNVHLDVILFIEGILPINGNVNDLTNGPQRGKPLDQLTIYACGECHFG